MQTRITQDSFDFPSHIENSIRDHLLNGNTIMARDFPSLPILDRDEDEVPEDGRILVLDLEPAMVSQVNQLREFWEEETDGSDQNLIILFLVHLKWIVEKLSAGIEVDYIRNPLEDLI